MFHPWFAQRRLVAFQSACLEQRVASSNRQRSPSKGRWGSIDKIETAMMVVLAWLPTILGAVFGGLLKKRARSTADLEEALFQDQQRTYRTKSFEAVKSNTFLAMIVISKHTKGALQHFLLWGEKEVRQYNLKVEKGVQNGRVYLGPTPLSQLVSGKAVSLYNDVCGLLSSSSETQLFQQAFTLLPAALHFRGRELTMSLILLVAAQWHFRVLVRVQTITLQLLLIVETAPDVEDPIRKALATRLLSTQDFPNRRR